MLDPEYSSYDDHFAKMVKAVELEIAAQAEEIMVGAMGEENWTDMASAKIAQAKVWVAKTVAEKLDSKRWGKHIELTHKGGIEHRHTIGPSNAEKIARLKDEQEAFLTKAREVKELPAAPISMDIIDAEVVSVRPVDSIND
jgi:hypothetical protein